MYVEMNGMGIIITVILAAKILQRDRSNQQRLLFNVHIASVILYASDLLWAFVDGKTLAGTSAANYIFTGLFYSMSVICPYLWLRYANSYLRPEKQGNKWLRFFCFLPALAVTLLAVTSFKTHALFYVDESHCFQRGPLYFLQPLVSFSYIIGVSVRALIAGKRAQTYGERENDYTIASFAIFPLISGGLQAVFPGTPLLCAGMTISAVMIFINMEDKYITRDYLTQLGNRYWMMNRLDEKTMRIRQGRQQETLYLLMMDVDDFKKINDHFGHAEGDRALVKTAQAMKAACREAGASPVRIGGDEFVVLYETETEKNVTTLINRIREELADRNRDDEYRITVSVGYARYNPVTMDVAKLLAMADANLYRDKKR